VVVGSPFNDRIDTDLGADTVTGGSGLDLFFDDGTDDAIDTLIEQFDDDMGLFNNTFIVGTLLNTSGNKNFEVGTSVTSELTDFGDNWSGNSTVEDLKDIFEEAELTGGAGNNTLVVSDLDNQITVGGTTRGVTSWRGQVELDNVGNNTAYPEHYLVTVRPSDIGQIDVRDSASSDDRLVVTGSDQSDWYTLSGTGPIGSIEVTGDRGLNNVLVTHENVENVELNSREAGDRFAVRELFIVTRINTSTGSDLINVGSNAPVVDGLENTGGVLDQITAPLIVNGQGSNDYDIITLDDSADELDASTNNDATLTATTLTNKVQDGPVAGPLTDRLLFGANGSLTYFTIEELNLQLGEAAAGNRIIIKSTHAGPSVTNISSLGGDDIFNVETIGGALTIDAGEGDDLIRVGSTTGSVGQLEGLPEALNSTLNDASGNAFIRGRLTVSGGEGTGDTLKVYDAADNSDENGVLSSDSLTGLGMTIGIDYTHFETLKIWLGDGDNGLYIDSTHEGVTFIDTGDEAPAPNVDNDILNINSTSGATTIDLGEGNDVVRVNYDSNGRQTGLSGIDGVLTLHGQQGSDEYDIGLAGGISSRINVFDQSRGDTGIDRLRVFGTDETDFFLFRANKDIGQGTVAALEVDENREPVQGGVIERINYDGDINGAVEVYGRKGDDTFVLDDNLAPIVAFGDEGDDTFQVGQVFLSSRDGTNPDNGLAEEDYFETTQITRGFLSNGISFSTTLFGGTGNDNFTVYRNKAELFLFGDEDDDTFTVRAFVKVDPLDPKAPYTNINGGQGADFIAFTVNAPVRIDGGDGFDTLTVIGTEFGDDFVINEDGVYGAGLFITYTGLEKVVVDAIEGNDRFFIESTSEDLAIEIVGGLGSDTFNVGGSNGRAVTVVSNNLEGHSGLVINTVSSSDPEYQAIFVRDISSSVGDNDEAGAVVTLLNGPIRVFEEAATIAALITYRYSVVLTRAPEENVLISASPTSLTEAAQNAGGKGIALNGSEDGIGLVFTRDNWYIPQIVNVTAPEDSLPEGRRNIPIQHTVIQGQSPKDGGAYDGLAVLGVPVEVIDNDSAEVLIIPADDELTSNDIPDTYDTVVAEDPAAPADLQEDIYAIVLTKAPLVGETVTIDLTVVGDGLNNDIHILDGSTPVSTYSVDFDSTNWHTPQYITVVAEDDFDKEATHYDRIKHSIQSGDVDAFLGVTNQDVITGLAGEINADRDQDRTAEVAYDKAVIELVGTGSEGDTWVVTVNGIELDILTSYTATSLTSVASALSTAIGLVDGLTIDDLTGSTITVSGTSLFTITVDAQALGIGSRDPESDPLAGEKAAARVTPGSGTSAHLLVDGPAFEFEATAPYSSAAIELTGTPVPGQSWVLLLNDKPYLRTVEYGDTLDSIAADIATLVDAFGEFDASVSGSILSIVQIGGSEALFTVEFFVAGAGIPSAVIVNPTSEVDGQRTIAELRLSGQPEEGTVWTLNVDGNILNYTVGIDETVESVAAALASLVNTGPDPSSPTDIGFTANSEDEWIYISSGIGDEVASSGFGDIFTTSLSVATTTVSGAKVTGTQASVTYDSAESNSAWTEAKVDLTGATPQEGGPVWTIILNGIEYSYLLGAFADAAGPPVVDDAARLGFVANNLADLINADGIFEVSYESADIKLSGSTAKGDVWKVFINPDTAGIGDIIELQHTVESGQTLVQVADALKTKIHNESGFTATISGEDARIIQMAADSGSFTIQVVVSGTNVEGGVEIRGQTNGSSLTISARENMNTPEEDVFPFTVDVQRLDSASDTNPPQVGGSVNTGTSTASTSHWSRRAVAFSSAPAIVNGTAWDIRLGTDFTIDDPEVSEAVSYHYEAGANRDITRPESIDVRVIDNDALGVLVVPTNDGTQVIEPTEEIVLGSGFLTQTGSARFDLNVLNASWTAGSPVTNWTLRIITSDSEGVALVDTVTASGSSAEALENSFTGNADFKDYSATFLGADIRISTPATGVIVITPKSGSYTFAATLTPTGSVGTGSEITFIGDFGTAVVREVGIHDSVFTAQDIDTAKWIQHPPTRPLIRT
jgi:hypothetical protein